MSFASGSSGNCYYLGIGQQGILVDAGAATRTNLTTQGIGIIFKKDFDKWAELLFWRRWKRKHKQAAPTDTIVQPVAPTDTLTHDTLTQKTAP